MKHLLPTIRLMALVCLLLPATVFAQLNVDAGPNITICHGASTTLGANPTASGVNPPFTYQWSPATGLSSDTAANPVASPAQSTTYRVTVTDNQNHTVIDSMHVTVRVGHSLTATVDDPIACDGEAVNLTATVTSQYYTALCTGNNITSTIGSGTIAQPGSAVQPPTLFGNFLKSTHNQMLYKSTELYSAMGGAGIIKAMTFGITVFNSNAFLQNFTIKVGFGNVDSLSDWYTNLATVYTSASPYQPQAGWLNGIMLTTPIYWDGVSDMIIDICWYNPQTFGNQNNKAECTNTAFKSYLWSNGNADQCGSYFTPTTSNLRPNVKLNYCTAITQSQLIPLNPGSLTFTWSPGIAGQIDHPLSYTTVAHPTDTTVYTVVLSDNNGCTESDSVIVYARQLTAQANLSFTDSICPGSTTIVAALLTTANDSAHYSFDNSSHTTSYGQGYFSDSLNIQFNSVSAGTYYLVITDSVCSKNYPVQIYNPSQMYISGTADGIYCYGDTVGRICTGLSGGLPPFSYLWDLTTVGSSCNDSLSIGTHIVRVTDALGCSTSTTVDIDGASPISINVTFDSASGPPFHAIATVSGGTSPSYTIYWGDGTYTANVPNGDYTSHDYQQGVYSISAADNLYGCVSADTVHFQFTAIGELSRNNEIQISPNPASNLVNISIDNSLLNSSFYLSDITGKVLYNFPLKDTNTRFDISRLSQGVYFTTIVSENQKATGRLVVTR